MDQQYCNRKRYRARDQYSSYKNKKRTYNNKYSNDNYKRSIDRSYSYRSRSRYDSYERETGHNDCYYVF